MATTTNSGIQLSQHFTLAEASTDSARAKAAGIDNRAPAEIISILRISAAYMEVVRGLLGKPITVSSWYRSLELNRLLKSKDTSQHRLGEAIDFICPGFGSPVKIVKHLASIYPIVPFDQLILEHTWVHISFAISTNAPKGQILSLLNNGSYAQGITDSNGRPL